MAPPPSGTAATPTPNAKGRSGVPILPVVIVIAVIAVVACGAFIALGTKSASSPAPSIAAVAATRTPVAGQSVTEVTPGSSASQPIGPSAPAKTGSVAGATCHSAKFGVTVTYPAAWHAYTADADLACSLFDPKPFPVITDGSDPMGIIAIFSQAEPMAGVIAGYQATGAKVLQMTPTTIDGKAATLLEIDYTGVGVAPNGMHEYMYVFGTGQTTLVIAAQGIFDPSAATADSPYDGYKDNVKVVDSIARTLKFD